MAIKKAAVLKPGKLLIRPQDARIAMSFANNLHVHF